MMDIEQRDAFVLSQRDVYNIWLTKENRRKRRSQEHLLRSGRGVSRGRRRRSITIDIVGLEHQPIISQPLEERYA